MSIQAATALSPMTATGFLPARRQANAGSAENIAADRSTISQEARDHLSSETANDLERPHRYRVEGPVTRFEDMVKSKGEPLIAVKMTDAQVNEMKLREQQEEARRNVNFEYAKAHQYKPVGQILVNGELVATVFDAGVVESPHAIPNLSMQDMSPADRLAEIARSVKGQIIYTDFLPTMNGWMGPSAPASMLPPLTARSMHEILEQEIAPAMEKKIAEWETQTGKIYPRHPRENAA